MLHRSHGVVALLLIAACTDRGITPPSPPSSTASGSSLAAISANSKRPEALARMVATALKNAAFRAYLKAQLDASPYREHKLQFQTFLAANTERGLREVAAENQMSKEALTDQARSAIALEIYFPVPAHRAAWTGDEHLLVATALTDDDPPVAFDTDGRRQLLDPKTPPAIPVLALVPVETDFSVRPARMQCLDCGGTGGGDPQMPPPPPAPPPPPPPGLYMTKSHFVQDFEGWLKGSPEFEVHILGQKGQTDSLLDYQCAGEHAGGPYTFDQNDLDWSGNVLLFSKTQLDQYNAAHPGQSIRVFVVEDDDTACQIKTDPSRFQKLIFQVDSAYSRFTSGNDSSTVIRKYFGYAKSAYNIWQALAALIKSNDDLVGNGVKDDIVGAFYPGYNWFVKGEGNITNGWINLVMY
ncbi:MAG TPA: hypothetical protein VG454_00025 [Gemmatimonadales bacterium]|nr:hypothetical protein [Gemmatimonadales bacterium]